jgi:hypothetical protein
MSPMFENVRCVPRTGCHTVSGRTDGMHTHD